MGLRTRAILLGVASYLASPLGLALGLGEIKMNSHLNQPLEAEIQLLQTRELSAQEILVGLGTREDFERVGVDRPFFLNDLKFTVEMNGPNGPVIRVKSSRLVKEPFLNFIVQAQWPSGKLLREYTVLLDLPVFRAEPARAVQAAKSNTVKPAAQNRPQTPRPSTAAKSNDGNTYSVTANDTLWGIALEARPSKDVSVQQTMLAIQRLNPNAFINNNINLLKRGAVLRLPAEGDITDFDPRQAKVEVAAQNRQMSNDAPQAQIDASRSNVDRGESSEQVQGRVKLTSGSDITGSKSGSGSADGEQDAESMRTQLLTTQEELASTKRENADLNSRIVAMDEQVQTMEKLLEVANADLRKLELALQEQNKQENGDSTVTPEGENAADPATGTDETTEAPVDENGVTPVVTEEPVAEVVKPEPVVKTPPQKKSIIDLVMENLIYIGGALVLLIGGLVYFLLTRGGRRDDEDEFEYHEEPEPSEDPIAAASETTHLEDDFTVAQFDEDDNTVLEDEITLDSLGSQLLDTPSSGKGIEEAENHIALGEYDEALAILDSTYDADPAELQLKKLEIYAKQDNLEAFDAQLASFEEHASPEQVNRAQDLRAMISSVMLGTAIAGLDQESEPDFDELDTTLQFDAITEEDIEASNDTVLDVSSIGSGNDRGDDTVLAQDFGEISLDDLDASLELDLDEDDLEVDLEGLNEEGSEPSEESVSDELDFESLSGDTEIESASDLEFDLDATSLDLDLDDEDDDGLSLDLDDEKSDEELTLDSEPSEDESFELDEIGIELRETSNIEEDSDELDLSSLSDLSVSSDELTALGSDLSLDEDLSLDGDEFELGDDLDEIEAVAELKDSALEETLDLEEQSEESVNLDDDLDSLDRDLTLSASDFDDDLAELDEAIEGEELTTVEPEALTEVSEDEDSELTAIDEVELPDFDPESDDDSEPGFLGDSDEVATKIDLLRVFVDMGDTESAQNTLDEIREEGNEAQKKEAEALFSEIG